MPRSCEARHPDPVATADSCPVCLRFTTDDRFNRLWGGPGLQPAAGNRPRSPSRWLDPPCIHRGEKIGVYAECTKCDVHKCAKGGTCLVNRSSIDHKCCRTCTEREDFALLSPDRETHVLGGVPGRYFNPSIIEWRGKTLFAYRDGWKGTQIRVAELGQQYRLKSEGVQLGLGRLPQDAAGREDPRLFVHGGYLHVSYSGVQLVGGRTVVHVCYARLGDDLSVQQCYAPQYPGRTPWEKNWVFFSHNNTLHCVYSANPHRVFEVNGNAVKPLPPVPNPIPFPHGLLRGGAPPVLIDGEYWHWFHSQHHNPGIREYGMGVYTFEAKAPFRPLRYCRLPLALPRESHERRGVGCVNVVFPGGAIRRGNRWLIAYGLWDTWACIGEWDHARIEAEMKAVPS